MKAEGKLLTGPIYFREGAADFAEMQGLEEGALRDMDYRALRPGTDLLAQVNASLR